MFFSYREKEFDFYTTGPTRSRQHNHHHHHSHQVYDIHAHAGGPDSYTSQVAYSEIPVATYGSYIRPLDTSGYTSSSEHTSGTRVHTRNYWSHPSLVHTSGDQYQFSNYHNYRRVSGAEEQTWNSISSTAMPTTHTGQSRAADRVSIDVVNESTCDIHSRYGRRFSISVESHASVEDIVSLLIQDERQSQVFVQWLDGVTEPLDALVPLKDLTRYVKYLVIRDTGRKRVHWSHEA